MKRVQETKTRRAQRKRQRGYPFSTLSKYAAANGPLEVALPRRSAYTTRSIVRQSSWRSGLARRIPVFRNGCTRGGASFGRIDRQSRQTISSPPNFVLSRRVCAAFGFLGSLKATRSVRGSLNSDETIAASCCTVRSTRHQWKVNSAASSVFRKQLPERYSQPCRARTNHPTTGDRFNAPRFLGFGQLNGEAR